MMFIKIYSLVLFSILLSSCHSISNSQSTDTLVTTTTIIITTPNVANAEAAIAELIGQHIEAVTRTRKTVPNYDSGDGSRWDKLAQCEAGGNWAANTGNGFGGGLQFMHQSSYSSWLSYGGGEFALHPWEANREQQIVIAERILVRSGWKAWPGCSKRFGWL